MKIRNLFAVFVTAFLVAVLTTLAYGQVENPQGPAIEKSIVDHFYGAIIAFVNYVNWLYLVVFMLLTWLVGDYSQATNKAQWLSFLSKLPRLLLAAIVGILLIGVFYWGFDYSGKEDVMKMLFSILTALVIYKIGINRVFAWLSKKLGLKFEA